MPSWDEPGATWDTGLWDTVTLHPKAKITRMKRQDY